MGGSASAFPIHDQTFFLGARERKRLADAYGIRSYRFVQRLGDMVLIPAGAPHQVRNLSPCVKVAMDFVCAHNLHRCLQLGDEFRQLSSGHALSEDKLQAHAMLYHALKAVLLPSPSGEARAPASAPAGAPRAGNAADARQW